MDKLEKLHSKIIKRNAELITVCGQPKIDNMKKIATKSAKLTKNLMIEFAEWCVAWHDKEIVGWSLDGQNFTTAQLFENFLKEEYGE